MIDTRYFVIFSAFIARHKSTTPKRGKMAGEEIKKIVKFDTIEDVKENGETQKNELKPEHLDTADCAFKPFRGKRCIHYMADLKILAKAQPFINGEIFKTENLSQMSLRRRRSQARLYRR